MEEGVLKEGDVCLLYDVGEERYGDGMAAFVESLDWTPKYILTGEPTESYQATGHKGSINMVVNSTGLTSHSSVPQYGRNAILQLFDYIPKLLNIQPKFPVDPFHGNTSISLSSLMGGSISNAVPDKAVAVLNARTGVPSKQIWDIIKANVPHSQYIDLYRQSASSNPLKFDVIKDWLPKKIMPYGTDLGGWYVKNLKFLLGVGSIATAHSMHEVVSKREMLHAVQYYKQFMQGVLNGTLTPIVSHALRLYSATKLTLSSLYRLMVHIRHPTSCLILRRCQSGKSYLKGRRSAHSAGACTSLTEEESKTASDTALKSLVVTANEQMNV